MNSSKMKNTLISVFHGKEGKDRMASRARKKKRKD